MKLRHFWRNNKMNIGMYLVYICVLFSILFVFLGDYISAMYNSILALVWGLVWKQDRLIDLMKRSVAVDEHNIDKHIGSVRKRAFIAGWNSAKLNDNK